MPRKASNGNHRGRRPKAESYIDRIILVSQAGKDFLAEQLTTATQTLIDQGVAPVDAWDAASRVANYRYNDAIAQATTSNTPDKVSGGQPADKGGLEPRS